MADQHLVDSSDKASLHRKAAAPDTTGTDTADAPHPLLRLQGQVGNATIARLLAQRADDEEEEVQASHDLAQRAEDEEEVQAKHETVGVEGGAVGPDTESRIQAMRGGGSPLDHGTRSSMESAFGTSFKDVRVHTGGEADTLNRRLTARAFTTGNDIFLRGDANAGDHRLLAHELSHVVQQRSMSGGAGMHVGAAGDAHERQADSIADVVASSTSSQVQAMPAQREAAEEEEVQAEHDLAQRQAEEEEVQAEHDLAQRQAEEEEEVQAQHDVAQRQSDEEEMA